MLGVVYLGSNARTQERLKYIPGQLVRTTNAYKEAAQISPSPIFARNAAMFTSSS